MPSIDMPALKEPIRPQNPVHAMRKALRHLKVVNFSDKMDVKEMAKYG